MSSRSTHPTLEDLLDHRDGRSSSATTRHLETCAPCRQRLEETYQLRSQLLALDSQAPPRDRWPVVRAAIERERKTRRRTRALRFGLAAAALVLFSLFAAQLINRWADLAARRALEEQLAGLREESQQLDAQLRALQLRAMPTWRAELLLPLEDDLLALDGEIDSAVGLTSAASDTSRSPSPDELITLWQDRLSLQDTMLQVHYAPAVVETSVPTVDGSL